jgi:hypothetical protein
VVTQSRLSQDVSVILEDEGYLQGLRVSACEQ